MIFEYEDPGAKNVHLIGDFNSWDPELHPLTKGENGTWKTAVWLRRGKVYQYAFFVDGQMIPDPNTPSSQNKAVSVLTVPGEPGNDLQLRDVTSDQTKLVALLRNLKNQFSGYSSQIKKLNEKLENYRHQLQTKDARIKSLQNELSNQRAAKIRNEQKRVNLKSELKVVKKERKKLRNNQQSLKNQIEKLTTRKKKLETKLENFQEKYNNVLSERPKSKTLDKLKEKLKNLKSQNKKLKKQVEHLQNRPTTNGENTTAPDEQASNENNASQSGARPGNSTASPQSKSNSSSSSANSPQKKPGTDKVFEGSILYIDASKNTVAINLHKRHQLTKDSTVYVFRDGNRMGALNVFRVFGEKEGAFSFCKPQDSSLLSKLQEGDTVRTAPTAGQRNDEETTSSNDSSSEDDRLSKMETRHQKSSESGPSKNSLQKPEKQKPEKQKKPETSRSNKMFEGSILYLAPEEQSVAIDLFDKHNLSKGSTVYAYRNGKRLGRLTVFKTFGKDEGSFSFCSPEQDGLLEDLKEGDTIRTRKK